MNKGMTTCKVCGRDFALIAEEHYIARDPEKNGIVTVLANEDVEIFDATDCPHRGCQNVLQKRKRFACPCDYGVCDECEEQDEEQEEQDGE